jgi:geranylgeranyl pyrophosphate synthase
VTVSTAGPAWLSEDLRRVERLLVETANSSPYSLVSEPSTHLLNAGGKRLRPALVVLSARAGMQISRSTDLAAAAIELVHLATLYHDDVIDGMGTRRGVPTAYARWGTEIAVLAGDYLFACACGLGARAGGDVPAILADAIAEVCEGQIIETAALGDPHRTVKEYLDTIRLKTAALFKASCELGSVTAGVDGATRGALALYGESLGLAFQIVDDLLDILGDPEVTGKVPGTDLKEGVFTVPILIASERDRALQRALASGERDLTRVLPVLIETGALRETFDLAVSYGDEALRALGSLPEGDWKPVLVTTVSGVLAQVERPTAA